MSARLSACALLSLLLTIAAAVTSSQTRAQGIEPHAIIIYHDSWDEPPASAAVQTSLAQLPAGINVVILAFAKPDLEYTGGLDLSRTGLEYRFDGRILHNAVTFLKARQPDTRVLLGVGGAAYHGWRHLNATAIGGLVHDLDADGVDIDFEPRHPGCGRDAQETIHCASDPAWAGIVTRLRAVLPRPAILSASVWSVGAYGEGAFRDARPPSRYTGLMLRFLRSSVAKDLDLLTIDAYDAGPDFDPMQAYRAYRALWPGVLALGLAVQRTHGAGPYYTAAEVEMLAEEVSADPRGAMMVYPLLAAPDGAGSDSRPDGLGLVRVICRGMGRTDCTGG
jgi:hypothetical protein